MSMSRNTFLDAGVSDESDHDDGYDSEAAEFLKGHAFSGRPSKRRRLSSDKEDDASSVEDLQPTTRSKGDFAQERAVDAELVEGKGGSNNKEKKKKTPGVVYLSSLPPYLRPSALRNLLSQRGFEPITRLFLTPASKAKSISKKNSRQLYTEGWIEFASKKTARRCAESLNASPVGGKKGGFYHDDIWNMKYLKGMGWGELMAGVREEKREEEGRRDEERRTIARETNGFLEGVEEGKRMDGMKRKRAGKSRTGDMPDAADEIKRTWRQFESKEKGKEVGGITHTAPKPSVDATAERVLRKIF